jgi:hypothetical protein
MSRRRIQKIDAALASRRLPLRQGPQGSAIQAATRGLEKPAEVYGMK